MGFLRETADKIAIARELMYFLWQMKMWWIMPIVAILVLFGLIIVVGSSTGVGPFIYTLF